MKKLLNTLVAGTLLAASANAALIFDASTTNTSIVSNNVNASGSNALTGSPSSLVFTNSNGSLNNSGFASTSDINTLLGTSLTATDTVTISTTLTSLTGSTTPTGIEFGMNPNAAFRSTGNLALAIRSNGGVQLSGGAFTGAQVAGFTLDMSSIYDGFGVTLTADNTGWSFDLVDVVLLTGSSATISGTFTGTQFVDNFGGGNFYLGAQKTATPDMIMNISSASVDVSVIPELSATPALLGISSLMAVLFIRRRRS